MRIFVFLVMAMFLGLDLYAQDGVLRRPQKTTGLEVKPNINVFPQVLVLTGKSGEKNTFKIAAHNTQPMETEVEIEFKDLFLNEKKDAVTVRPTKIKLPSIKEFIQIKNSVFTLKPDEKKILDIDLSLPKEAMGSYYFTYTVKPTVKGRKQILKAEKGKTVITQVKFSSNIYLLGGLNIENKSTYKVDSQVLFRYTKGKLIVQATYSNIGNAFSRGNRADIVLLKDGNVISQFELKPIDKYTWFAPGMVHKYMQDLDISLNKGNYVLITNFTDSRSLKRITDKKEFKVE